MPKPCYLIIKSLKVNFKMLTRNLLFFVLTVPVIFSCSSTKKVIDENTAPQQKIIAPSGNKHTFSDRLSKEELENIHAYAAEKAGIVCQIEIIEINTNDSNAERNKTKIVALDMKISKLNNEIESYLDNDRKRKEFNRVFNIEYNKCKKY